MSRVGYEPIKIPPKVNVKVNKHKVIVKGPKGILEREIDPGISVEVKVDNIIVNRKNNEKKYKSLHGLNRTLIKNMIVGVTEGYLKKLMLVGTGYKVKVQGKWLILSVGYSHDIYFEIPSELKVETEKLSRAEASAIPELQAIIDIKGSDKELLGNVVAAIRDIRPPGSFNKCKGIRYSDEHVKKKPGKVAGGTAE